MPCVIGIKTIPKQPTSLVFFIKNDDSLPELLTNYFINLKTDDNQTSFIFSEKIEQYRFIKEDDISESFIANQENYFVLNENTGVLSLVLNEKFEILVWHDKATLSNIQWFYRTFIQQ